MNHDMKEATPPTTTISNAPIGRGGGRKDGKRRATRRKEQKGLPWMGFRFAMTALRPPNKAKVKAVTIALERRRME